MNDRVNHYKDLEHLHLRRDDSSRFHSILDYTLYLGYHINEAYEIDPSHQ